MKFKEIGGFITAKEYKITGDVNTDFSEWHLDKNAEYDEIDSFYDFDAVRIAEGEDGKTYAVSMIYSSPKQKHLPMIWAEIEELK